MATAAINPRGLHTHGKQFFAAAEAVHSSAKPLIFPLAFLWGRTVELLLKSYLLSVGVSGAQLRSRKFGHNPVALHAEARMRGIDSLLGIDPIDARLINILNLEYESEGLEYRENGANYSFLDAVAPRGRSSSEETWHLTAFQEPTLASGRLLARVIGTR